MGPETKASAKRETIYYADSISFAPHSEHVSYRKHIYQYVYVDTHISNLPLAWACHAENERRSYGRLNGCKNAIKLNCTFRVALHDVFSIYVCDDR